MNQFCVIESYHFIIWIFYPPDKFGSPWPPKDGWSSFFPWLLCCVYLYLFIFTHIVICRLAVDGDASAAQAMNALEGMPGMNTPECLASAICPGAPRRRVAPAASQNSVEMTPVTERNGWILVEFVDFTDVGFCFKVLWIIVVLFSLLQKKSPSWYWRPCKFFFFHIHIVLGVLSSIPQCFFVPVHGWWLSSGELFDSVLTNYLLPPGFSWISGFTVFFFRTCIFLIHQKVELRHFDLF